jgi:HAD superfamily hydrolase (TIGR01509 family)
LSGPWEAALFDVDGTLVDSLEVIVKGLQETFSRFQRVSVMPERIREIIGRPLREQVTLFSSQPPTQEQIQEMTEFAIQRFAANKAMEREFAPSVLAMQRCRAMGLKTALVTSKSQPELDLFLSEFSGADAVDTAVCACHVVHPKPDPESASLACARLGVSPERSVFVGDSIFDVRCARSAGCFSIAVAYGSGDPDALRAEHPDVLLDTPDALLAWVEHNLAPSEPAHA